MIFRLVARLSTAGACCALMCLDVAVEAVQSVDQPCEIQLEKIVDLKGDEVGQGPVALVTSDRVFLVRLFAMHEIAVFDRKGRFLRTVGREGEGPGEFKAITGLVELPNGDLAVFDWGNQRLTYLGNDLEWRSDYRIPVGLSYNGAVRRRDGGWVLAGQMTDFGAFGSPLVHVDSMGEVLAYYGRNETEKEGIFKGRMFERKAAYHPDVGAVSMKKFDYFIEVWNDDGTLAEVFDPEVDWFHWPPPPSRDPHRIVGEPENLIYGIQFDGDGRLWILAHIEGEDWESGIKDGQVVDEVKWIDYRIEVLDLKSKQVLCATRVTDKHLLAGFQGPGIIHSYSEDLFGRPTVTFWQLTLRVQ